MGLWLGSRVALGEVLGRGLLQLKLHVAHRAVQVQVHIAASPFDPVPQSASQLLQTLGFSLVDALILDVLGLRDGSMVRHDSVEVRHGSGFAAPIASTTSTAGRGLTIPSRVIATSIRDDHRRHRCTHDLRRGGCCTLAILSSIV